MITLTIGDRSKVNLENGFAAALSSTNAPRDYTDLSIVSPLLTPGPLSSSGASYGAGTDLFRFRVRATQIEYIYEGALEPTYSPDGIWLFSLFRMWELTANDERDALLFNVELTGIDLLPVLSMSDNQASAYARSKLINQRVTIIDGSRGNGLAGMNEADTIFGNDGNDTLWGLGGNDTLSGGVGYDILDGGRGADSLMGGDGNDILIWHAVDTSVNGGTGSGDALRLVSGNLNLAVTPNTKIVDIEKINLTGAGANTLTLSLQDLLDISSTTDTLKVLGEAGDTVDIVDSFIELEDIGAVGVFTRYQVGAAVLLVDSDINVI